MPGKVTRASFIPSDNESARQAAGLVHALAALRTSIVSEASRDIERWRPHLKRLGFKPSALNLAHYLALRKRDLRPFQEALVPWGLSSLGRSEARVLANLDAVLVSLAALSGSEPDVPLPPRPAARSFTLGERLIARNATRLFGPAVDGRQTHLMVTVPEAAELTPGMVDRLLEGGMSCARLNCAHGTHAEWLATVIALRAGEARTGRRCRILMDLGGPRARTVSVWSAQDRRVVPGDRILLRAGAPDPSAIEHPFQLQCAPVEVFSHLHPGTTLSIDEGRIGARVESSVEAGLVAVVIQAPPGGVRLKPEKGLNFPGTSLGIPALTDKDRDDLDVVATHADLVGYSFVQDPDDISVLWRELGPRLVRAGRRPPGLILKIETARAVRAAPELIVAAAEHLPVGLMIARGDLAVEVGFQRLAELQEELLWLAEAAHVPVVWATQVLDRLVKKGTPTRAEISDVVLAARAECIMLNKGPFIPEALAIIDDVCRRMAAHQHKKTARLRPLGAWSDHA